MKEKLRYRVLAVVTATCLLFSISFAGLEGTSVYGAEKQSQEISGDYAEDQIIVVFEDDVNKKEAAKIVDKKDGEDLTVLDTPQDEITGVVELPKEQTVEEAVKTYEKDSGVAYAQPNYRYSLIDDEASPGDDRSASKTKAATASLNDTDAEKLWHLNTIQAEEAWELLDGVSHQKTRVAVLDTGVDTSHPDLQANLNKSLCRDTSYGDERSLNGDDDGHGTHVSGIIAAAANNNLGVAGVASGADNSGVELFVVDVFQGEDAYTSAIIAGIQYASRNQAKVINMSLGYANGGALNWEDYLLKDAVDEVTAKGTTVVCAAGNDNNQVPNYPADFDSCISVISTNQSNERSNFSNYGKAKDLSAPGGQTQLNSNGKEIVTEGILSSWPGGYAWSAGTSMASPVVAGVASLLYSIDSALSVEQIKDILYETATDIGPSGWDNQSGYGIVNAKNAVDKTLQQLRVPTGLNLSASHVLSWNPVSGATGYTVTITDGNGQETKFNHIQDTQYNLAGQLSTKSQCTISVQAVDGTRVSPRGILQFYGNKVTQLRLSNSYLTIGKGYSTRLSASVAPGNASNKTLRWESSRPGVAMVSRDGVLYAMDYGTTTVTASTKDGSGLSASCQITVPYTISYRLNGGKNNPSNPSSYYGSRVALKNPTRKGYTFDGWYTSSSYRTKVTTLTSGNYTLYAKWKKVSVKRTSVKSLKRVSKTKLKVSYKKISGAKGYQITYSTSKKYSKKKTKSVTASSTKKTLKKLKKGKTYYVKVRAYKKDSQGGKVYGKYSKTKKIKLKK